MNSVEHVAGDTLKVKSGEKSELTEVCHSRRGGGGWTGELLYAATTTPKTMASMKDVISEASVSVE